MNAQQQQAQQPAAPPARPCVNPFYVLAGIDVAIFFTTFILLFVNIKPNYDRANCNYPLAAFLVITYLEVNFLQVLVLVAHGFEKARIYIWMFTFVFVPAMLVFNVVGNVWVSKEDRLQSSSPNACVSKNFSYYLTVLMQMDNKVFSLMLQAYMVLAYCNCLIWFIIACAFSNRISKFMHLTNLEQGQSQWKNRSWADIQYAFRFAYEM